MSDTTATMSRLSKNILYNVLGQGLLIILGFVAVKYVFRRLGEDALGIIYFTQTISAVFCALLEMGIGSVTVREVSAHVRDEPSYVHELIRTGALSFWGAYVLLALGVLWGAPLLVQKWVHLRSLDSPTATRTLQILGCAVMVALPRSFYASIFRGLQRMEFNNLIDVAVTALQQFGTIVVIVLGGRLVHVAYWFAACSALSIGTYLFMTARFFPWRTLVPGFSSGVIRRNFAYASRMASISLLSMVQTQADKAVVSKVLPLGTFGYYGLAYSAVSKGMLVSSSVSQAAFPSLSELYQAGKRDLLLSQYGKLHDLLCFAAVPIFTAFPFAALPLFTFVLNAEAARLLLLPVAFLCLGFYMNATLNIPYVFSLAVGKPGISARSNFYALFMVSPVTVLLVYFWGLNGAGLSWIFYHLFAYTYGVPRICRECLGIPTLNWYLHVLKAAVPAILTYGVAWMVIASVGSHSILSSALAYLVASIVFLAIAYASIGSELRESLSGLFQLLRPKGVEA